jgi:transcriptional regulator with XRE-family HTH domain
MNQHDAFYADVGRRIYRARKECGLTQEALASLVALTRTSIVNIEKGRQKMLLHTLIDLAIALKRSPADLLPPTIGPTATELDTLLKGRSRQEQEWIKSAVTSVTKEKKHGR